MICLICPSRPITLENCSMSTDLEIRIDVKTMKPAGHNTHTEPMSSGSEVLHAPSHNLIEEVLSKIALNYLETTAPAGKAGHDLFLRYMKEMRCTIMGVGPGSLVITVKCDSLEALDGLWEDYLSGHLGEVVQRCFVTEEILTEVNLVELKLKTTILEEAYKAYKVYFESESARG